MRPPGEQRRSMKNDGKKLIDIFSISHRPIEKRHQIRHIPQNAPGVSL